MSSKSLKYIEVTGDPRQMGREYGEAVRIEILKNIEVFCADVVVDTAVKQYLSQAFPEIFEEMTGIADGANVPLDHVIAMNQWRGSVLDRSGCTPVCIRTDTGALVAKNNDGTPGTEYEYVVRKSVPAKGLPMLQMTYAGWLSGLDAINAGGLANTHGSVGSVFQPPTPAVDVRLAVYALMRYEKRVTPFMEKLRALPLTGKGFNIVVGDRDGNTAVLEAAVPVVQSRNINEPFVYATNHYVSEGLKQSDRRSPRGKEISRYRLGYLEWRALTDPPSTLEGVRSLLQSHDPWAPCRHGGAHVSATEWSMINVTAEGKTLIAIGSPCRNAYKEFFL